MEDNLKISTIEYLRNHWSEQSLQMVWRKMMPNDLKILRVEYLGKHWLDPTQTLNLSKGDQTRVWKGLK